MDEKELALQTIPKDNKFPVFLLAFGKKFGLVTEYETLDEGTIRMYCKKIEERLLFELKEFNKTS